MTNEKKKFTSKLSQLKTENKSQFNKNLTWISVFNNNLIYIHKTKNLRSKYRNRLMGKPTICIGENKDADQLRGDREADQRLCFRYWDSTFPLLLKSEISSFQLFSVLVQAGLCRTWSETTLLVFPRGGSYEHVPAMPHSLLSTCMLLPCIYELTVNLMILMSRCTRKQTICVCENKDANQLCSNSTADQRLCFRCLFFFKSEISSF